MTAGASIFGVSFQVDYAKEVGFGPLVAALTPDYFGELQRHQLRSGLQRQADQRRSGLHGGHAWGYDGAYALAGGVSLMSFMSFMSFV